MRAPQVFITHGRAHDDRDALVDMIRKGADAHKFNPVLFKDFARLGDYVPAIIESIPSKAEAAIIMATPDDFGGSLASDKDHARARQNVWIELGLFWGRLGRLRTLLLVKGDVEIPSDLRGILFARYRGDVHEVREKIDGFLIGLTNAADRGIAEVVYASSERKDREHDWFEIQDSAEHRLTITGTAMGMRQRSLPMLVERLTKRPNLQIEFVVVDPAYIDQNAQFFETHHGRGTRRDNKQFFRSLESALPNDKLLRSRVFVYLYRGPMSFSAVAADAPELGSELLAQTNLPRARERAFMYPRTLLRKRVHGDLFDAYWEAIELLKAGAHERLTGNELARFVARLRQ